MRAWPPPWSSCWSPRCSICSCAAPGQNIHAVANNRKSAELMGIPSSRVLAISFGIGTMLAAVSGGLLIWQSKHKRCGVSARPTVNCWISLQRN
ncbi:MAG: hypothetical protein IPM07_18610 [Anaerolineales bacterium]|nr:hypothetical protein [Anaerolineales bacterium]